MRKDNLLKELHYIILYHYINITLYHNYLERIKLDKCWQSPVCGPENNSCQPVMLVVMRGQIVAQIWLTCLYNAWMVKDAVWSSVVYALVAKYIEWFQLDFWRKVDNSFFITVVHGSYLTKHCKSRALWARLKTLTCTCVSNRSLCCVADCPRFPSLSGRICIRGSDQDRRCNHRRVFAPYPTNPWTLVFWPWL